MKRYNHHYPFLLIPVFFYATLSSHADTVYMKDGGAINGEIIDYTPTGVLIEYIVTPSIKDEKNIPSSQIKKIVKVSEEQKDYSNLNSLESPDNALDTTYYDILLDDKLPDFMAKYPYSSHLPEIRSALQALTTERDRINAGDRKLDGIWYTAHQLATDPIHLKAKVVYYQMIQAARENDPVKSLKSWELLQRDYPSCRYIPDAADLALSELTILSTALNTASSNFALLQDKREKNMEAMPADYAEELKNAISQENSQAQKEMTQANEDGTKFFPVFPNTENALSALNSLIQGERQQIMLLKQKPLRDSLLITDNIPALLAAGNITEAEHQLQIATQEWGDNAELPLARKRIEAANSFLSQSRATLARMTSLLSEGKLKEAKDAYEQASSQWRFNPDLDHAQQQIDDAVQQQEASNQTLVQAEDLIGKKKFGPAQDAIDLAAKQWPPNPELDEVRKDLAQAKPKAK